MITSLVIVSLLLSFLVRFKNDGTITSADTEKSTLNKAFGSFPYFYLKLILTISIGMFLDRDFSAYHLWWDNYTADHSIITFLIVNTSVLALLMIMKEASYEKEMWPGTYEGFKEGIYRRNMKRSLIQNALFYGFLLLSPTLPFFKIIILKSNY